MGRLKNPYIIRGGPRVKKSVVAFVDILGYTELVCNTFRNGKVDELLRKLHRVLKESQKHVDPRHVDVFHKTRKKDFSAFRAFTDNIVIGYPILHFGEEELNVVFRELSHFQMTLAVDGFFVRGAISVGDLYIDDIAVFGPALIEAYKAEQKLARDPRIVLAQSARKAVNEHLEYYAEKTHASHVRDLWKDADGQYFVNYLNTVVPEEGYFYEKELEKHKSSVEGKLREYRGDPPKWSKYMWVAGYHNYFCDTCPKAGAHMKIDIENFRVPLGLIIE